MGKAQQEPGRISRVGAAMTAFRGKRYSGWWMLLFLYGYICWCELLTRYQTASVFWGVGLITTLLFSAVTALILFTLCSLWTAKVNRIIALIVVYGLLLFYVSQIIYNKVFHFFYYANSVGNGGQVLEFWRDILKAMQARAVILILMVLPAVLFGVYGRVIGGKSREMTPKRVILLPAAIALHLGIVLLLPVFGRGPLSPVSLYREVNDFCSGAGQLGLLPAFRLDVHRMIFGFDGQIKPVILPPELTTSPETTVKPTQEPITEPVSEPPDVTLPLKDMNVLSIDFNTLLTDEEDEITRQLHEYFNKQEPTAKNDKTGIFAGCNLIEVVAEGFSYLAVSPELTPTLYKMQTEGISFTNFYTAYWGVSTSDGEYVTLTGTIPKSGTWSFNDSAQNALPLTMVQQLKRLGYTAYAFHDHSYTYYHRDQSHPNMGYVYRAVGNGLEITDQWPESDVEMIDQSTAEFLNQEPFHTYYLTVSGHLSYNFTTNMMAIKNREFVEDLPYSEPVRAYLACQIELDRAMELLLTRLEEAGVADNTVIVLSADHYPYGLTNEQISELAGHEIDTKYELYRNACFIYKKGMQPETVDRMASSLDILPTLSNLFGLAFDSRLYMGQDVFSDAEPLVLFSNRSWMTPRGSYYTLTEEVESFTEEPLSAEYIAYYNDVIYNKFLVSEYVLETDYWRLLFGDNLPPADAPPEETLPPEDEKLPEETLPSEATTTTGE